jgi:UDP-N-acetylglucosamine 4,6-dehydratase
MNMPNNSGLADTTLLITGGTGSFGQAVLRRLIDTDIKEIRIFSRDEKKQDDLRRSYPSPKLRFMIGDIRNSDSILAATRGVDFVFSAAALKQVPSCEFFPMEAVRTNIIGTENLLNACIANGVKKVVCLSTDKAVYPINAMGMSKALMEKTVVAKSRQVCGADTIFCITRYGNVMGSRGSVIPLFMQQVAKGLPLTITDSAMTRFMMTLDDAVDLVLFAFSQGRGGDLFVQKSPAATIEVLARAVLSLLGKGEYPIVELGTRHGEKQFESLITREEMASAEDLGAYYRIPADFRNLNYEAFFSQGKQAITSSQDYNSNNTQQLDVQGMKDLLRKLPEIQRFLNTGILQFAE